MKMQSQWDEEDYVKAEYLIRNGFVSDLDVIQLAIILYNKRNNIMQSVDKVYE